MRIISGVLIAAWMLSIGNGCASTAKVTTCSSTKDLSENLKVVKSETASRAALELIGNISDCLQARAKAGTIGDVDDSIVDQLIDLLDSDDDGIRGEAALSLGWFGPRAQRAIPALEKAYIRIEKDLSTLSIMPASASDADIVAALERITGKSGSQLKLPTAPKDAE